MKEELEKLVDLQITDTNIRQLKKAIESATERRAAIEQEFDQHAFSIKSIQERRETLLQERTEQENKIAENKTYLERADRNLKNSQNQKEYETAMRETDALQKQIAQFETTIEEKNGQLTEVEAELESRSEEIGSLDAKRSEALTAFDSQLEADKKELEGELGKRDEVFKTLTPRLATVYDRLAQRSRDGIAVAAVVNNSCSACFMSLRPQVMVEVKRGDQIITCESCTRILYVPKAAEEAAAS